MALVTISKMRAQTNMDIQDLGINNSAHVQDTRQMY